MTYEKTFTQDVRTLGDYDETPDSAVIVVDDTLRKRILQLQKAAVDLNVAYIEDHDYTPEFKSLNSDEELVDYDHNLDCVRLVVSKDEFWWQAMVKHTDISIETESVKISDL